MAEASIRLVRSKDAEGVRNVWVNLDAAGDLILEAQDLGPGVEAIFGAGNTEYEWELRVFAKDLPRLLELLGAAPEAAVLDAIAARFSGAAAHTFRKFLEDHGIAGPAWSRVGS